MRTFLDKIRSVTKDRAEYGLTLLETVLYITVLSVLVAGAVSLISDVTGSTARFSTTTATQSDVNRAQAIIQRDIGLANEIVNAGGTHLQFNTKQDNTKFLVTIFSYGGAGKFSSLPQYVKDIINENNFSSKLPNDAAVIEIRQDLKTGKAGMDTLTKGYDPIGYSDPDNAAASKHLFSYYNDKNILLALDENAEFEDDKAGKAVRRIEFRLAADAPGRASKIQAESSVSPLLDKITPSVNSEFTEPDAPLVCPPNFAAQIVAGDRHATITWNQVQNATSYIVKRYNVSTGVKVYEKEFYIADPSQTTYREAPNTLEWGASYVYTITANGSGTTLQECAETPPRIVVPDAVDFRNINPHADLGISKAGAGLETLTGTNVANISRTAQTQKIGASLRYTVARDLINQLSWEGVFGATNYDIYRVVNGNRTLAATIPANAANTAYSWQEAKAFGDSTTYVINARNDAGSGQNTASVNLISPPNGTSTYTAVAEDPNAALSQNKVNLTKAAPNTVGFRAYATATFEATCTTSGTEARTPGLDFSQASGFFTSTKSITHPKVQWGSSTCYKLVPFNDAGSFDPAKAPKAKADQAPKRFSVSGVTSSVYYSLDYKRALPSTAGGKATCWVSADGSTSSHQCYTSQPASNSNRYPVGAIEPIPNGMAKGEYGQPLRTSVRWGSSEGAKNGYSVTRVVSDQGNGTIVGYPTNNTTNLAYANASGVAVNGVQFNNEKPGTRFDITVTAKAKNGKTRVPSNSGSFSSSGTDARKVVFQANKTFSMQTRPDMSGYQAGNYQQRVTYPISRIKYQTQKPGYGKSTNIYVQTRVRNDSDISCTNIERTGSAAENWFGPNGGTHYSAAQNVGCNYRTSINYYNTAHSGSLASVATSKVGRLYVGSCYSGFSPCGTGWSNYYDKYPNYWAGMHTRAHASTALNQTNYKWSAGTLISGQKVPGSKEPGLGGVETGNNRECNTISESEKGFTTTFGCKYGTGIPPVPSDFTYKANGGTSFTLTWGAVTAAKNYVVSVNDGAKVTEYTVTSPSYALTIPSGKTYKVNVKAVNTAKTGPASGDLSISNTYKPAAVKNLTAVNIPDSNSFDINWTANAGATAYNVTVHDGKKSVTTKVVAPTYRLKGAFDVTYTVTVEALEGTVVGHPAQLVVTGEYELAAVAGLEAVMQEGSNKYTLTWQPVTDATKYVLKVMDGTTVQLTKDVTGTTTTVDVPFGTTYSAVVYAVVTGENTPDSEDVSVPGLFASAPKNFTSVEKGDTRTYDMKWDAVKGADEYELTFYDESGSIALTQNTTATNIVAKAPTQGTFKVTVRAVKGDVLGAESTNVTVEGSDIQVPFLHLTRAENSNDYVLTWSAVENAEGYELLILNESGSVMTEMELADFEENYKFSVPEGETWTITMRAIVSGSSGAESDQAVAVGSYLKAPTALKVVRTPGTINYVATWKSPLPGNTGVGYNVTVTDSNGEELSAYNTTEERATVSVPTSATYNVNVTTLFSGTAGGTASVKVEASTTLLPPTDVKAVASGDEVILSGTPAAGGKLFFRIFTEDGEMVYESPEGGVAENSINVPLSLFEGGIGYSLHAYTISGADWSLATEVPVELGKLATPVNVNVSHSYETEVDPWWFITSEWLPVENATGYAVKLKNAAGEVIFTGDVTDPSVSIWTPVDLKGKDFLGQTLTIEVIAQSTNPSVLKSNPGVGTIDMPEGLNSLKLTNNYDVAGSYPITWDAVPGAETYSVKIKSVAGSKCVASEETRLVTGTVVDTYQFTPGCTYVITVKPNNTMSSSITETISDTMTTYTFNSMSETAPLSDGQTANLNVEGFVGNVASGYYDAEAGEIVYGKVSKYTEKTNNPSFVVANPKGVSSLFVVANGTYDKGTAFVATGREYINEVHVGKDSTADLSNMFNGYASLEKVNLPEGFAATSMNSTFKGAAKFNQNISNWDVSKVKSFAGTFQNAATFNQPLNNWDVSSGTDFSDMFNGAAKFNQDIGSWDVSKASTMKGMFRNALTFNNDSSLALNNWNVSNVTTMEDMFREAQSFSQGISGWNTGSVTNMANMFNKAYEFDVNLSGWNVSNVSTMEGMFREAVVFNNRGDSGINNWETANVNNMASMFYGTTGFNQPLNGWDTAGVKTTNAMFRNATAFNQPLNNWDMSSNSDISSMFYNTKQFDSDISTWDVSRVTRMAGTFSQAAKFNQDISAWAGKLSNVETISNMFAGTQEFDQDLSSWDFTASTFNSGAYKNQAAKWVDEAKFPKRNGETIL